MINFDYFIKTRFTGIFGKEDYIHRKGIFIKIRREGRQFVYSNAVKILRTAMTSFLSGFTFHEYYKTTEIQFRVGPSSNCLIQKR